MFLTGRLKLYILLLLLATIALFLIRLQLLNIPANRRYMPVRESKRVPPPSFDKKMLEERMELDFKFE
jgi:hypothetical protein